MAFSYPVKWMSSSFRGAPVINGLANGGGYVAALHAFLVTGYGAAQAVTVSVTNGIGSASFTGGVTFEAHAVVQISGAASPALLNGEARVLTKSGNNITFETNAPDGIATGSIEFRYAPVGGWERLFVDGNKAVFRSVDPRSPKFCVRVDDTMTVAARVRAFESMSDIDTGIGPFPTNAQINGGGWHGKAYQPDAKPTPYFLVGDSRSYLFPIAEGSAYAANALGSPIRGFGDMIPLAPGGDAFAVALACVNIDSISSNSYFNCGAFDNSTGNSNGLYLARDISGTTSSVLAGSRPYTGVYGANSGSDTTLGPFPSAIDGELKYSGRYIAASDNMTPRANVPGVYHIPQSNVWSAGKFAHGELLNGSGSLSGRKLLTIATAPSYFASVPAGFSLIDVNGPWRPL